MSKQSSLSARTQHKVARSLKHATQGLITLAIISIAIAIVSPASRSSYLVGGLIMLVLAFLCVLWRIFFLKLPINGRGGAVLTIQTHPISYRAAFLAGSLIGGLLLYVLIQSYLSAPSL